MSNFAGTGRLIRLALRRDRIKLPAWIISISGLAGLSGFAIEEGFSTLEDRITYAATVANSAVSRAFEGVVDGPSFGSIMSTELFVFTAVLAAFMSSLAIVRHTRQNEETGSAEMISSTPVGRYAQLSAALIVMVGANLITALLLAVALASSPSLLDTTGSIGFSLAIAAVGISFGAVAAVPAQAAESARGANSMVGIAVGISFLLRAVGDAFGAVNPDGLSVTSAWPSWLSPLGWGQQIFAYTQGNWWVFGLFAVFSIGLVSVAFTLLQHRDIGLGLFASKKGPARASRRLLSPLGLAWRLQRTILFGWIVGFAIYGSIIGGIAKEFEELIQTNEMMQEFFGGMGGNFQDMLFGSMFLYVGAIAVAYCAQAVLRLRSEETNGHLESILSTPVGRIKWFASHAVWLLAGTAIIMATAGLFTGIVDVLVNQSEWSQVLHVTGIALVQLPPVLAVGGTMLLVFGLRPNLTTIYAWGSFIGVLIITQLGLLLRLPDWVMNISPFGHMSLYPVEPIATTPIVILLAVAVSTTVLGAASFRRRDLTSS
jgi:ABC-2 type transport system permease protein